MNRFITFLLVLMVCTIGCKDTSPPKKSIEDIDSILIAKNELLPDMCSLVPLGEMAKILGVPETSIAKINSTPSGDNPKQKTCFFKWEDPNFPNSAIMVQSMVNPLGDEYPNYIVEMMNTKRARGENTVDSKDPQLYQEMSSEANEALYNTEAGKYFWRFSDKVIFQLAFNTAHDANKQKEIGQKLGDKMIEYYLDVQ